MASVSGDGCNDGLQAPAAVSVTGRLAAASARALIASGATTRDIQKAFAAS